MRAVFDKILWGTLILLFGPTVMIVASWNSLPGDTLYGVKLGMERDGCNCKSILCLFRALKSNTPKALRGDQTASRVGSLLKDFTYLQQQIADTKR